jgi:hypothetical protein
MESVHGLWTTGTSVHDGLASIAGRWSSPEPGLWPLLSSRPTAKGQGMGSGAWGARRLTMWRPSDGERWQRSKARGGEGVADSNKRREGWEQLGWSEVRLGHCFIAARGWGGGWPEVVVGCH